MVFVGISPVYIVRTKSNSRCTVTSMYIVISRDTSHMSRDTSMAAVVYRTNLNMTSLHLQSPSVSDTWELTRTPTQSAGYTVQLAGSA